tara:strand:- start:2071 stop:3858 length:1788 start_codon:yes stop_codon:yes gene_type:complete
MAGLFGSGPQSNILQVVQGSYNSMLNAEKQKGVSMTAAMGAFGQAISPKAIGMNQFKNDFKDADWTKPATYQKAGEQIMKFDPNGGLAMMDKGRALAASLAPKPPTWKEVNTTNADGSSNTKFVDMNTYQGQTYNSAAPQVADEWKPQSRTVDGVEISGVFLESSGVWKSLGGTGKPKDPSSRTMTTVVIDGVDTRVSVSNTDPSDIETIGTAPATADSQRQTRKTDIGGVEVQQDLIDGVWTTSGKVYNPDGSELITVFENGKNMQYFVNPKNPNDRKLVGEAKAGTEAARQTVTLNEDGENVVYSFDPSDPENTKVKMGLAKKGEKANRQLITVLEDGINKQYFVNPNDTDDRLFAGIEKKPKDSAPTYRQGTDKNGSAILEDWDSEKQKWVQTGKPPSNESPIEKINRQFTQTKSLREELSKDMNYKNFKESELQFAKIKTSAEADSAAGDMSLIFAYMKMLDPDSVVREGEQATAENARGIPDTVKNFYNKAMNGEKMGVTQRADFVKVGGSLFTKIKKLAGPTISKIKGVTKRYELNQDDVFGSVDKKIEIKFMFQGVDRDNPNDMSMVVQSFTQKERAILAQMIADEEF